jgi:hypothetical protein
MNFSDPCDMELHDINISKIVCISEHCFGNCVRKIVVQLKKIKYFGHI